MRHRRRRLTTRGRILDAALALLEQRRWNEISLGEIMGSALVAVYARHGRLFGALAEAANHDAQVRALYLGLADRLIAAVSERITADVAAGRSRISDAEEVARALIWMNERYLDTQFGRDERGDPERASRALSEVWVGALYGAEAIPDDSPSGAA
jgi:AcrR family transcriptional regulator